MKYVISTVLLGFAACASATPDQIKSSSPNGKLTAVFERNSDREDYQLKLINQKGETIFASGAVDLQISNSIIWNSNGDSIAFAAGTHFLMQAFVLIPRNHKYFLEKVPSPENGWDNFHQIPEKWKGALLTLQVDGPHAGKAREFHYEGSMIIDTSKQLKVVSENINAVEQGAAANP